MAKPTEHELQQALRAASFLRDNGRDSRHLAKSLIYLERRVRQLERVAQLAERYMHAGHDQQLHSKLVRALHETRHDEARESRQPLKVLGL